MEVGLTAEQAKRMIQKMLEFPQGQICKHLVVLEMIQMLESNGLENVKPFVKSVSDCDDCAALELLKTL